MSMNKHDYDGSIFKSWLCFGVSVQANDADENAKLKEELMTAGYSSYEHDDFVVISPNDFLFSMFKDLGIRTLAEYRPKTITPEQWADHGGALVPTFTSLLAFF
jgi:hypothetical protein